ncbi:hypothetical protein MBSD_n0729 [Mizugakiibacter sediminis]|uniref:Uncharacterized protein n=1 Tax=Mizugakiibacter sediminis TaxID=1475481 RepID=A0A0K8QKS9_9GAMM|nr:putative DNA-binding domain-containing protein [Mizugakiibacter sediminis]GAP65439.1 hypothetical protein MBSD_n0729 [Mizugakiibacter sediminis]
MPLSPEATRTLQYRFAAHLRDPENIPAPPGIEDRRLQVYRELFFNNVESLLAANFPVIRRLHDDAAWRRLVRDFYREHPARSPLFHEIGGEFIAYLEARATRGADDPPFLPELAHYEYAETRLALDEREAADVPHDPDGDPVGGVPVPSPLAWLLQYRWPVHRIGPEFRPAEPPAEPTLILLLRNAEDRVEFHALDPLGALLFARLQANERLSGLECLDALLAEHAGTAPGLREAGIALLRALRDRGALLGTRPR